MLQGNNHFKKKKTSGTSNSKGPDFSPLPSNIYLYYKTAIVNKNATHTLKIQSKFNPSTILGRMHYLKDLLLVPASTCHY